MLNSSNMAGFFTKSISQIIGSSYYNKAPEAGSQYILGTSPPDGSMELYILDNKLQVCSCPREKIPLLCHSIIRMALLPDSSPSFFSLTEAENMTLILTEEDFKQLPENVELETSGQVWRVLTVSVGALGSFNEIMGVSKIAKSAIGPLADHNVSVLCLSTYQSDYILVQESQLNEAIQCLSSYFKIFNEDHQRVSESKATTPLSPTPRKSRPIVHPYQSPDKIFHIAGLDASKLSGVVQVLLELMFFPKTSGEEFSFFHFTIVHGDISLVLDDDSFNKFPKNTLYSSQSSKDGNWKIISIGEQPLGFVECGIVAQVVEPLASSQVSSYYLSTYDIEYCMVHETDYEKAKETFEKLKLENFSDQEDTPEANPTDSPDENENTETAESSTENNADIRPGENMSLSESLDNIHHGYPSALHEANYSRSPLTPTSECSSYGTSPLSDVDIATTTSSTSNTSTSVPTDPIPIPSSTCLRDSITRLKC